MKKLIALISLGALIVSGADAARAQDGEITNKTRTLAIRVGGFFPSSDTGRSAAGEAGLSAGVDYALFHVRGDAAAQPLVYLDYQGGKKSGGHMDVIGAGIALRSWQSVDQSKRLAPYFGAGGGYYYITARQPGSVGTVKNGFGAKAFAGAGIGGNFFVEGAYHLLPNGNPTAGSGFTLQIGAQF